MNQPAGGSVAKGLGATVLGCLAFFVVCALAGTMPGFGMLGELALTAFFGIGIAQFVYVVPLLLWARATGERATIKGIWIAAAVTFLLNAACFGVILSGPSRFAG